MKLILQISLLLLFFPAYSQVPESFNYQFVATGSEGAILIHQNISIQISILKNTPEGVIEYSEVYEEQTNNFGQINLQVGRGTPAIGNFSQILWGESLFFIKTEISIDAGETWQHAGTTQLLSVPYALHAKTSDLKNLAVLSQSQIDTLPAVAGTVVYNSGTECLNYYTGTAWMAMCGECLPQPSPAEAGNDQIIVGSQTILEASFPDSGDGLWEIFSGNEGVIAEPENPVSIFYGIQPLEYILRWNVSTACGSNADMVNIHFVNPPPSPPDDLIFAPYVDCLLWPNFDIGNLPETGICIYTCAFIVDNQSLPGANPCWGGYSTLGTDYYQDKIANLRSQGGDIIMSFGGANGIELAYAAADEFELKDAIQQVIEAYNLNSIDFDIEGFYIAEPQSIERRSKAMKLLQDEYPALQISLTLPVMPDGLTNDGLNVISKALEHNVELGCINIMAMDYGPSGIDMGQAAIAAGEALFDQLKLLYVNAGNALPDSVIWKKIGITPMIGENDVAGEIFYLDDATELAAWAADKNIGRLSMWSANRDKECANPNDPLYSCSRIDQQLFEFSSIFGAVATNPCNKKKKSR